MLYVTEDDFQSHMWWHMDVQAAKEGMTYSARS